MNKAFQTAFWKGERAALAGQSRRCPYEDKRNSCGVTFSRTFRRQWFNGFDSAMKEMEEEPKVKEWRHLMSAINGRENRKMVIALMENQARRIVDAFPGKDPKGRSIITDALKKTLKNGGSSR